MAFFGCFAQSKLEIEPILTKPAHVTSRSAETGRIFHRSTNIPITKRLEPMILMQTKTEEQLFFFLQGNISSGGHSRHRIKKIRFEKGEQFGNVITLKYFVGVKYMPGKESSNIQGYNYKKLNKYKIPKDIKVINIELYEERLNERIGSNMPKIKLLIDKTFDFYPKI